MFNPPPTISRRLDVLVVNHIIASIREHIDSQHASFCWTKYNRPTIPYNTIQYNTIQYNAMQCNAMQCNAMQCNATQRNATQRNATRNATQHNTIQYNTMQCNTTSFFYNIEHNYIITTIFTQHEEVTLRFPKHLVALLEAHYVAQSVFIRWNGLHSS